MFRPIILLIMVVLLAGIDAHSQQESLEITGLRIYTENELTERLSLREYGTGKISPQEVIGRIENFYKEQGYILVKTYIVQNDENYLKLFIDEGRIGKIIFLKTDTFSLFWLRYKFKITSRVYNSHEMGENLKYLRDVRGYKNASIRLKEAKNYDNSFFQLDRMLKVPVLGEAFIPFFDRFGPRFDLEIDLSKTVLTKIVENGSESPSNERVQETRPQSLDAEKRYRIDLSLNLHYVLGFIPRIKYTQLGLISDGDAFIIAYSMGVMYGIDGRFSTPPKITFMKLEQYYIFTPSFRDLFTPYIRSIVYKSSSARFDLGILTYNYLQINTLFAPGITLLSRFRMYSGLGVEIIRFDRSINDPNHVPFVNIDKKIDIYNYVEVGLALNTTPIRVGDPLKNNIFIAYDYYTMITSFHEFKAVVNFSAELRDRSIYSLLLQYTNQWGSVPFNHETSVSNSAFKGFMGRSFFSRGALMVSNEILLSIYRDYIYAGAYFDTTVFQGSGRDVRGIQGGIVGGPTVRVLLLDQMEFYLYVGWDLLFSDRSSNRNITFNLYKKW